MRTHPPPDFLPDEASDLWALGAILGELVQLKQTGKRFPLFAAKASRLSPGEGMTKSEPNCPQLESIASVLGAPAASAFPLAELHPPTASYLKTIRDQFAQPAEGGSLRERFPEWSDEDRGLVCRACQWGPQDRPSSGELLADPYFDPVRGEPELYGNIAEIHDEHRVKTQPVDGPRLEVPGSLSGPFTVPSAPPRPHSPLAMDSPTRGRTLRSQRSPIWWGT